MSRSEMINALEEYWLTFAEQNPEEAENMDIPAALEYYHMIPMWELEEEYRTKIKQ
jgi:hypothetical protein